MSDDGRKRPASSDAALREIFRKMDAASAQEIRDAYYNAIEGLRTLADALEMEDAKLAQSPTQLIDEHLFACEALDAMKKSRLGAIL
jgi:hypothetical protein